MELDMPTYGCAHVPGLPTGHMQFQKWEKEGGNTMRFFIEPVALTVAYAKRLGYKHIVMAGFSGGGWTTHVAAVRRPFGGAAAAAGVGFWEVVCERGGSVGGTYFLDLSTGGRGGAFLRVASSLGGGVAGGSALSALR